MDGSWTSWGSFGDCTVSCGGGFQTRNRSCTNPSPKFGGKNCSGQAMEKKDCANNSCPCK